MKRTTRICSAVLTAAAVAALAPGAASAATYGSLSVSKPRCSNSSGATISITAKPKSNAYVVAIFATKGGPPGPGSTLIASKFYVSVASSTAAPLPLGVSRTLRVRIPIRTKIYIGGDFTTGSDNSSAVTTTSVGQCAKPKFTG